MKKIYILFAVGLLVCANLYASSTKDVVIKKYGKKHKEYGKKHKEYGKRHKEYGKKHKEYGKRPKIAIMPIKSQMVDYCSLDLKLSSKKLASLFSRRLTTRLTQTHKFDVLVEELGADYLLVGEISKAKLKKKEKFLKTVNCTITKYKASFVFNYQLISRRTKQIIFTDVAVARYQSKKLSPGRQPKLIRELPIIINNINDVVERVVDQLCSMRVVSVKQDGTVIISQGTDKISKGMWLDIFSGGEEFLDYDTKKSLGKDKKLVAKVKVEKVKPKIIYAKVICGDVSKISKGLVCRVGKAKKDRRLPFLVR